MIAMGVVAALALVVSLGRLPSAIGTGVDAERSQRYLAAGRGADAVPLLERIVRAYPDSLDSKIELADAYEQGKRPIDSARLLESMNGVSASPEQTRYLDSIVERLKRDLPEDDDSRNSGAPKGTSKP